MEHANNAFCSPNLELICQSEHAKIILEAITFK